jgi:hypothetical protein
MDNTIAMKVSSDMFNQLRHPVYDGRLLLDNNSAEPMPVLQCSFSLS